jgi:hypothetical protein
MIGKSIFHTNIVVRDLERSLRFIPACLADFIKDGDLVLLTTLGRNDILTLNPSGHSYGFRRDTRESLSESSRKICRACRAD